MTHFLAPLLRDRGRSWTLVGNDGTTVVAHRLHGAFDSATRRTGLLGKSEWPAGAALIIAPCQAVHTIGMRFPIDVMFVDRQGVVVKTRSAVGPWRMAAAWRAFAAIELPAGTLDGLVRVGDQVRLVAAA